MRLKKSLLEGRKPKNLCQLYIEVRENLLSRKKKTEKFNQNKSKFSVSQDSLGLR